MSLDAISTVAASSLGAIPELATTQSMELPTADLTATDGVSFETVMTGLEALNERLVAGSQAVHALAMGQTDNLHQVMMTGEQTRLAFDFMLQVRSKLLDAYQELFRMQV